MVAELRDLDLLQRGNKETDEVTISNITEAYGALVVAGSRSREFLERISDANLDSDHFPWLTGKEIVLAGVPLRALRINHVGKLGWELHILLAHLEQVYDEVWTAGGLFGIVNFGSYAVNSIRPEKAWPGWGVELTNEITLIEAELERFVKYDIGDFVGRESILRRKQDWVQTSLVYVGVAAGEADVRGSEPLFAGVQVIGMTKSGGYGYAVKKEPGLRFRGSRIHQARELLRH